MSKVHEKYKNRKFAVVAVNGWDEERDVVARYVDSQKLKQKVLLKGGRTAARSFGVRAYPTSFWVTHNGKVIRREEGFDPGAAGHMEKRIEGLIARRRAAENAAKKTGG